MPCQGFRSGPHVLFQEVLLQLVQQGVRFPHVGLLHEGQVPHLIECSRPCGFEFLSECPPDGFDLLFELRPRSFDFAVELPPRFAGPHCAPPSFSSGKHHERINGVFWTVRLQSNGIEDGGAPTRRVPISGPGTCHPRQAEKGAIDRNDPTKQNGPPGPSCAPRATCRL